MVQKQTLRCLALLLFLLQFINFKILTLVCSLFQAFQSNERHSSGSKTNTYLKYSQKGWLYSDQAKPERLSTRATPVSRETLPLLAVKTWTDGTSHHLTSKKKACARLPREREVYIFQGEAAWAWIHTVSCTVGLSFQSSFRLSLAVQYSVCAGPIFLLLSSYGLFLVM